MLFIQGLLKMYLCTIKTGNKLILKKLKTMKKVVTLIVVALFTTATFAQDTKMEVKHEMHGDGKMKHECYMMKDGALMHCMGDKAEAQKTSVKLKGGTVISPNGEIKMKDGKTLKLENGQCMSMMGSVGDCGKMHSPVKEDKLPEQMK